MLSAASRAVEVPTLRDVGLFARHGREDLAVEALRRWALAQDAPNWFIFELLLVAVLWGDVEKLGWL